MDRARVPGVAVGVIHGDQTHTAGFGVTHIEHPLPVTPDTLFQIGSISKTFLGTAMMRLVEQGHVDLDTPVKTVVPELTLQDKQAEANATMRHLLTHMGGWVGDYFDDFGWGDDAVARYVAAMATLPQVTPLGAVYSYNNAGFNLAGRVIEKVTGQTFEDAMQILVFDPLGLHHATYWPWEAMLHRVVVGHISPFEDDHPVTIGKPWPLGRSSHPAGGVIASVNELLAYARFHMGDGAGVLSGKSLTQMRTPQVVSNIVGDHWGITFSLRPFGNVRLVGHGGATKGQMATFQMVPERNFAVAVLTNSDRGSEVHGEAVNLALKLWLNVEKAIAPEVTLSPEALAAYAGPYISQLTDVTLKVEDGILVAYATPKGGFPKPDSPPGPTPPPTRLSFSTPDLAIALDDPWKGQTFEFLREAERIRYLRTGGRVRPRA
jgi:CubicO group peptidase (beta-lactamase class C family)